MLAALLLTACTTTRTETSIVGVGTASPPPPEARTIAADAPPVPAGAWEVEVERVVDGDTLVAVVTVPSRRSPGAGERVRLRLLRIDTPELGRAEQPAECLAEEARLALERIAGPGRTLVVAHDVEELDRFDRELVHAWTPEGAWVNGAMLESGYANVVTFPPNVALDEEVRDAERRARDEGVGLWDPSVC
ncbi:MAG: thermonuclease family protein [Actinomycetes bacterium]